MPYNIVDHQYIHCYSLMQCYSTCLLASRGADINIGLNIGKGALKHFSTIACTVIVMVGFVALLVDHNA